MLIPPLALTSLAELVSREQSVALLTAVGLPLVALLGWQGWSQGDRPRLVFCGYALALLALFWVHLLAGLGASGETPTWWRRVLSNGIQLPYAWLYLRFFGAYFDVCRTAPGWARWLRGLAWAYVLPVGLIVVDIVAGVRLASWFILGLNLANLLGSYVGTLWFWRRRFPGAGAFLTGVFPMALAGVLLALQWVVEPGGYGINGMFPFWLGVLLHLLVFFVVLQKPATSRGREPQRA